MTGEAFDQLEDLVQLVAVLALVIDRLLAAVRELRALLRR